MQTLLGNLELDARPTTRRAERAYRPALAPDPGYARGRARAWRAWRRRAATSARDPAATGAWSPRLPLPEYVVALGEAELAAGRRAAARRDLALVGASSACCGDGVNTDVELALFEADHGSPARAVDARTARLGGGAQRALRRRARLGADARRADRRRRSRCAQRALRLGSRDPISSTTPA